MKERGIIFSSEMVRAILDGRKTQTRRIVKSAPTTHNFHGWIMSSTCAKDEGKACWAIGNSPLLKDPIRLKCPLGKIGDRLWVRETWQCGLCTESTFAYKATHKPTDLEEGWNEKIKWHPSSQMPRWASRILLEITGVRVERLQDISEEDAIAEGVVTGRYGNEGNWLRGFYAPGGNQPHQNAKSAYSEIWRSIYGVEAWYKNPLVWVIEFKQIQG
ncbi:TPA: hypothetical protein RG697_003888 [Morganella morganii]|nr:hypothetical protein [Morganella morganii]